MSLLANVPTLSYISWKNMIITYNETTYQIENSHTNRMYIYWDLKNPYLLTTSNVKLEPRNDLFYIIFNNSGTYTVVPNDNIEIDFSENPSRSAITNRIVGLSNDTKDRFTAVQIDIDGIKFDVYDAEGKFSKFEQRVDKIDLEVKGVEKKYSDDPQLIKMREDFNEVLLSLQATLGLFSSDMNTYMEDNSLSSNEKNNIISYKTSLEQKRVELNNQLNEVVEYLNGIEDIDQARIIEINASKDGLNTAISNLFTNIDVVCSDNVFTNTEITAIVSYFGKTNLAINECKNTIDYVFLGIGGFLIEEVSNITLEQDNIKLEVKKVENHIDTEIASITLEQGNIKSEVSKKVGKTEVISSINQTAESIKIQANKITLEGYVTINQGFSIDTNGNMTANNGKFNGGTIQIQEDVNNYVKISDGTIWSVNNGAAELMIKNGTLQLRDTNNVTVGHVGRATWRNTNIYLTSMSAKYGSTVALSASYTNGAEPQASVVVSSKDHNINSVFYRQGANITAPEFMGSSCWRGYSDTSQYRGHISYNSYSNEFQVATDNTLLLGVRTSSYMYPGIRINHDTSAKNKSNIQFWAPIDFNNFPISNANITSSVSVASVEPYTTNSTNSNEQLVYVGYTGTDGELRYVQRQTQHTVEEWDYIQGVWSPLGVYYCYCELPNYMQGTIESDYHVNISKLSYGEYKIIEKNQWLFIVESTEENFAFTYEVVAKRIGTPETNTEPNWNVWSIEEDRFIDGNTIIKKDE